MTLITGSEPDHWHRTDADGKVHHALGDPRKDGIPKSQWGADLKRYVAHLEAHERANDPATTTRMPGDLPIVEAMFDLAETEERKVLKLRQTIVAIRQAREQGKTDADIGAMFNPPDTLSGGGTDTAADPVTQALSDALCAQAVRLHRVLHPVQNDPDSPASLLFTVIGRLIGLREALCVLHGWNPAEDADTEGPADELVLDWWQRHHPEEWNPSP